MDEGQLHGKVGLENKINMGEESVNQHNGDGNLAEQVRKAVTLDYIDASDIGEDMAAQKKSMPELIDSNSMSFLTDKL